LICNFKKYLNESHASKLRCSNRSCHQSDGCWRCDNCAKMQGRSDRCHWHLAVLWRTIE